MIESINNPFNYPQSIIDKITLPLDIERHCGDKVEVKINETSYSICTECGTIIENQDLFNLIENRSLDGETQPISIQFLETHAIFRCDEEHDEEVQWSLQCLIKGKSDQIQDEEVYI